MAFGLKEIAKAGPAIGGDPRTMDQHDGLRHQFPSHEGIDASYRLPLAFLVANGLMETGIEAGSGLAIFAARFMWLPICLEVLAEARLFAGCRHWLTMPNDWFGKAKVAYEGVHHPPGYAAWRARSLLRASGPIGSSEN